MSQMGLALLQMLSAVLLLPPVLSHRLLLWLSVGVIPLLCLCLLFNPIDLQIAKMAQGKKPKDALTLRVRQLTLN
jgi:Tfp pilus assembly protein PilN